MSKRMENCINSTNLKGKSSQRELGICRGISLLPVMGEMCSGMIAYRLRDWLMHRKKLTVFQTGCTNGRRTVDNIFIVSPCIFIYLLVFTNICTFIVIKILHKQSLM